jgi:hypothetical protein
MSEIDALESAPPQRTPWTRRLVLFLRVMAFFSMAKGLIHWAQVIGIGDGGGSTFENATVPWQAATVFFAVIDLVAAVGLWLAAISMASIEMFFPQVFGGRIWIAVLEFVAIFAYVGLALMAGKERPD